ncbi:CotH kinase family protein [Candidatus Bipolaricaulota bacterium]|nr:CotH kinase family protein [Candidatus Bipolaricaulota bacterium]
MSDSIVFRRKSTFVILFLFLLATLLFNFSVLSQPRSIVINEFLASNQEGLADGDRDHEDWIELYNPTTEPINLEGYTLTDRPKNSAKWSFPEVTINPKGFLLLWASGKDRRTPGNWDFKRPLRLEFKSAGYADGDFASILVDGEEKSFNRRGINIARLGESGNFVENTVYDTWESREASDSLVRYLDKLPEGDIVVFTIKDEGSQNLHAGARSALEDLGSKHIGQLSYWDSWGMIAVAGKDKLLEDYKPSGEGVATGSLVSKVNLHTNFNLNKNGESLNLFAPDGTLVDSINFKDQVQNVSYGRHPDGGTDWCYFSEPTPVWHNDTKCATGVANTPKSSIGRGFYEKPVTVKLRSPDNSKLYYTLAGTVPTKASRQYSKPLVIEETKVLRVRAFKDGRIPSEVLTRTFFIGQSHSLPVLSLVTDPANLWDKNTGIYTEGHYPALPNYSQRGEDWERPVAVEFYEEDKTPGFAVDAGVRIHGASSRTYPKKSFRIYFRGRYEEKVLNYPVFREARFNKPNLSQFRRLIIRSAGGGGSRARPRLRDPLMHALWAEEGGLISAKRTVFVYLNGEQWGIYNIRERIDEYYLASNYGVEDADLIKASRAEEGDVSHWNKTLDFFESSNLRDESSYARAQELIDVENFTDFWIFQIYSANVDIDGNLITYRSRSDQGKWHWIMWDMDMALSLYPVATVSHNTLAWHTRETSRPDYGHDWADGDLRIPMMLRKLLKNEEYRNYFINRFVHLLNTTLHPDHVIATIDDLASIIEPEIPLELERWSDEWGGSVKEWQANLDGLRDFSRQRPQYLRHHIIEYFELSDFDFR